MSYRITVNGEQLFGNNEAPKAFIDFLKDSGVKISADNLFDHVFKVGINNLDIMKAISAIEQSIIDYDEWRKQSIEPQPSIWDFTKHETIINTYKDKIGSNSETITDHALMIYNNSHIFIPVIFIQTLLKDGCIKPDKPYADSKHLHCYTQCETIYIEGK